MNQTIQTQRGLPPRPPSASLDPTPRPVQPLSQGVLHASPHSPSSALRRWSPGRPLAQTPVTISPAEAAKHVGERVTVEGEVAQVSLSTRSETTYLNFGGRYPNHVFTGVIFKVKRTYFPDASKWEGKRIRVTGVIQLYREKPEIILNEAGQVELLK